MKIGILGGGLTGLALGYFLEHDFEILEKEKKCGGLCGSLQENGFTFDTGGGHILFSRNKEVLDFMTNLLSNNIVESQRNTKIYFKKKYVKYPFEKGLSDLPIMDSFECFYYFFERLFKNKLIKKLGRERKCDNFQEWMFKTFGKGITEKYLLPFNEKIWGFKPEKMHMDWTDGRVPNPELKDVLKDIVRYFGGEIEGYKHQLNFYYPRDGGIEAVIKIFENKLSGKIEKNFAVKNIRKKGGRWIISNGIKEKKFDKLVSTIPLPEIINALPNVPAEVKTAADNLVINSHITIFLGFKKKSQGYHWIYMPEKKILPYKLFYLSNCSPNAAPEGKSSLMAQITCRFNDDIWNMNSKDLIEKVIWQLEEEKLISASDVCHKNLAKHKYAYIVYDIDYKKNIETVHNYLKSSGIELCGRFAEFKYMNMDDCIGSAMNLAKALNT